jgi:hypothetical protein
LVTFLPWNHFSTLSWPPTISPKKQCVLYFYKLNHDTTFKTFRKCQLSCLFTEWTQYTVWERKCILSFLRKIKSFSWKVSVCSTIVYVPVWSHELLRDACCGDVTEMRKFHPYTKELMDSRPFFIQLWMPITEPQGCPSCPALPNSNPAPNQILSNLAVLFPWVKERSLQNSLISSWETAPCFNRQGCQK